MPPSDTPTPAFWNEPIAQLITRLGSATTGLSERQASQIRAQTGPNVLQADPTRSLLRQFLGHFSNPLVLILLAASTVSALTGDVVGFFIITTIVLMSVLLDFVQEFRADRAAARLKQSVQVRVTVLRDGQAVSLPVPALVPGDVVRLAAGDLVPADGRVLEAHDLFVNQALLTGESYPVEKRAADLATPIEELSQAGNAVFMGTSVISGAAQVLIGTTGAATAVGRIADSLARRAPPTEFELGTHRFGVLILRLTLLLVLFVFLVNTLFHRPLLASLLFALALAVGLTPELLPMVISVTLSRGALRMAKRHVVVKRLASIHDLGSMDVLCTDKTGTLTEARIELERHIDATGRDSARVLELAYLNSWFETGLKSPLDDAILAHSEVKVGRWTKVDEVPFDFERRRVSVLIDDGERRCLMVKGAPEDILALCARFETGDGADAPLDAPARTRLLALHDSLGEDGFRVLGIAWRPVGRDHPHAVVTDESELVFSGYAAFLDPPKHSAGDALRALAADGVAVKIVSGDSVGVARHVCQTLGIPVTGVLTGADIQQMDEPSLMARAEQVNLFCRVNPAQKSRILHALKARGHTVGFLGDGVNDAPALHLADVGISVDSAVDVAKDAAAMILLRHDLRVLHAGVLEGRRTFGNIMKYIMMGTSSNFGNMFSMAGATLFLPFLPMLPAQILLNNLLYDVSEIAIPLDNVDRPYLRRPQRWDVHFIRRFMWVFGPISSLFDLLTFGVMLWAFHANEALFRSGWFVESLASQVLVIFVIRTRGSPLASHPAAVLTATSLGIILLATWLPFSPIAGALGFVPLPASLLLMLAGIVAVYLVLVEVVKRRFYRQRA